MSKFRDQIDSAKVEYLATEFPGDLAALVMEKRPAVTRKVSHRPWVVAAGLAALAASLAVVLSLQYAKQPPLEPDPQLAQQTTTKPATDHKGAGPLVAITANKKRPSFRVQLKWLSPKDRSRLQASVGRRPAAFDRSPPTNVRPTSSRSRLVVRLPRGLYGQPEAKLPKTADLSPINRRRLIATAPADAPLRSVGSVTLRQTSSTSLRSLATDA